MKKSKCFWSVLAAVLLVAAGYTGNAQAQDVVSAGFNLPVNVGANLNFDCSNSPGPVISLGDGVIRLGEVGAEITLSNNVKFTHSTDPGDISISAAVLLKFGTTVEIPKQPSRPANYYGSDFSGTGVGGNPRIYVEFYDQNGKPPKDLSGNAVGPLYLGRCVQGAAKIDASFLEAVIASTSVFVDSGSCSNNPGPWIYLDNGNLFLSGLKARVIFTNNAKFTHAASGDAYVDFEVVPGNGFPITWPKQPVLGGVGGNPRVYYIFKNGDEYVGTWPGQYLGRCIKL